MDETLRAQLESRQTPSDTTARVRGAPPLTTRSGGAGTNDEGGRPIEPAVGHIGNTTGMEVAPTYLRRSKDGSTSLNALAMPTIIDIPPQREVSDVLLRRT